MKYIGIMLITNSQLGSIGMPDFFFPLQYISICY